MATPLSGLRVAAAASQLRRTTSLLSNGKSPVNGHYCPRAAIVLAASKRGEEADEHQLQGAIQCGNLSKSSRRAAAIGAAAAAVTLLTQTGIASAAARPEPEDNGFWLTSPLPRPTVDNKIANGETGTRSFLRDGIYMANIGADGSAYRLRQYAFDLMALGDLMGQDAWSHMRRYLCLKSTVMYYDFDKVISAAAAEQRQPLLDLANRLFDTIEELEESIKKRDDPMIESHYAQATPILQEVMTRMA